MKYKMLIFMFALLLIVCFEKEENTSLLAAQAKLTGVKSNNIKVNKKDNSNKSIPKPNSKLNSEILKSLNILSNEKSILNLQKSDRVKLFREVEQFIYSISTDKSNSSYYGKKKIYDKYGNILSEKKVPITLYLSYSDTISSNYSLLYEKIEYWNFEKEKKESSNTEIKLIPNSNKEKNIELIYRMTETENKNDTSTYQITYDFNSMIKDGFFSLSEKKIYSNLFNNNDDGNSEIYSISFNIFLDKLNNSLFSDTVTKNKYISIFTTMLKENEIANYFILEKRKGDILKEKMLVADIRTDKENNNQVKQIILNRTTYFDDTKIQSTTQLCPNDYLEYVNKKPEYLFKKGNFEKIQILEYDIDGNLISISENEINNRYDNFHIGNTYFIKFYNKSILTSEFYNETKTGTFYNNSAQIIGKLTNNICELFYDNGNYKGQILFANNFVSSEIFNSLNTNKNNSLDFKKIQKIDVKYKNGQNKYTILKEDDIRYFFPNGKMKYQIFMNDWWEKVIRLFDAQGKKLNEGALNKFYFNLSELLFNDSYSPSADVKGKGGKIITLLFNINDKTGLPDEEIENSKNSSNNSDTNEKKIIAENFITFFPPMNYDITIHGAELTEDKNQKANNAYYFNGKNNYIDVKTNFNIENSFSVAAWFKPMNIHKIMNILSTRRPYEYSFDMKITNGNLIHGDIGNGNSWITTNADVNYSYQADSWYHLVYVVNNIGYKIFMNGEMIKEKNFRNSNPLLIDSYHNINIGRYQGDGGIEYFEGIIDSIQIFNKSLSNDEVKQIFLTKN